MKLRRLAVVLCVSGLELVAAQCSNDACLGAVQSATTGLNGTADCLDFLQVTVTPATSTVTTTVTVARNATSQNATTSAFGPRRRPKLDQRENLEERQVTASQTITPSYASSCPSIGAYSSACSCLGISRRTITATARSTTTTLTITRALWNTTALPFFPNSTARRSSKTGQKTTSTNRLGSITTPSLLSSTRGSPSTTAANQGSTSRHFSHAVSQVSPEASSVVFVISATTLVTLDKAFWANTTVSISAAANSTVSRPWDSSAAIASTSSGGTNTTSLGSAGNATSTRAPFGNSTSQAANLTSTTRPGLTMPSLTFPSLTMPSFSFPSVTMPNLTLLSTSARWPNATSLQNTTTPMSVNIYMPTFMPSGSFPNSTAVANLTSVRWPNSTVMPTLMANLTSMRWPNSTVTPTLLANLTASVRWPNTTVAPTLHANSTSVRWPNSTISANATTARWLNTTSTSTPTPTPTIDTSCGETVAPFALQVAHSGGPFNGWFLSLVGNALIFTRDRSSADSFSVEASGHLCVVGVVDDEDRPSIAAVGTHDPSGSIWLLQRDTLDSLYEDYAAVKCTNGGGSLSCVANTTSQASHWLGCGLQLDLSTDDGSTVPVRGLNCSSIGLSVV